MSWEKQACVRLGFDRLAAGAFLALAVHLVAGTFRGAPFLSLAGIGFLQAAAAALYLARFARSSWRPRRTAPFRLHLPAVALMAAPCCLFAADIPLSFLVAGAILVAFFAHFCFLEAFLARERGLLSPKGFAALTVASGALIVAGRLAERVVGACAGGLPWRHLAPPDGVPVAPFDHLYDLILVAVFPVAVVCAIARGATLIPRLTARNPRSEIEGHPMAGAMTGPSAAPHGWSFWGLAALVIAVGILLSFCRAAWIALAFQALLLAVTGLPRRRAIAAVCVLLAAGLTVMLIPGVGPRVLSIFSVSQGTNIGRLEQWTVAMELIGRSPFLGHGLGSFGRLFLEAGGGATWYWCPHNLYLHIAVECGIPALFVFLAWIVDFLRQAPATRSAAFGGKGDWRAAVRYAGMMAVCGLLVYGMFDL